MAFSQGVTDKKYITALGIDKRDWLPSLLKISNDDYLTDIMELAGRYKPANKVMEYSNFVSDALFTLLDTTGATVTGSGTATVATTLTAATSGFARKSDLIKFPNRKVGLVTNVVTTSNQDTLTIKSVDGTNLTHTAGELLSPFSNAFGEKSTPPVNRKYGQTKYTNQIQAFREVNEETDIQSMSQVELSYNGSNYVIVKELAQKAITMKAVINGAMIGGIKSVTKYSDASPTLTDGISGGAVQTTSGLDEYVSTYGVNGTVGTPGSWSNADLTAVIGLLLAQKASKNYLVIRPTKAAMVMDSYYKGITSGINAGKLSLDGKSFDFGVEELTFGGFNFQFSSMGIMDNQEFFSQTNIVKSIYFIPKDEVKTYENGTQPRIQIRYAPHNVNNSTGSEYIAQWDSGALARPNPVGDELIWRTNWVSYQGLEVLGAQHFAKYTVLS